MAAFFMVQCPDQILAPDDMEAKRRRVDEISVAGPATPRRTIYVARHAERLDRAVEAGGCVLDSDQGRTVFELITPTPTSCTAGGQWLGVASRTHDPPISPAGRRQAEQMADYLASADVPVSRIVYVSFPIEPAQS